MLDIEEFKKKLDKKSRLIGIDPGKKRIGIAVSDENKRQKKIVRENTIKGIVIGNPINMDGSSGSSSQSAKDLAINLSKDVTQNITMWDERLSSEGAFNLSSNLDINVSKKVQKLDENAAQFILQGALDYLNKNNT